MYSEEEKSVIKKLKAPTFNPYIKVANLFLEADVEEVIKNNTFDKALGHDEFCAQTLKSNEAIKNNFCMWLFEVLNGHKNIPAHFHD